MPYGHKKQSGLIFILLSGDSTFREAMEVMAGAFENSAPPASGGLLAVDVTGSEIDIRDDDAQALADHFEKHKDAIGDKVAFLVRETAQIDPVRLVSAYSAVAGIEVQPFFKKSEMIDWLKKPR
jgi:hypothetical protein